MSSGKILSPTGLVSGWGGVGCAGVDKPSCEIRDTVSRGLMGGNF